MMKETKHLKAKIFFGYAALLAAGLLAAVLVFRAAERIAEPDDSFGQLRRRRTLVNQMLYHLLQAEGHGQLMLAGYRSQAVRYGEELWLARSYLDTLRTLPAVPGDTLHARRIDTLIRLIADKQRRTTSLFDNLRAGSTAQLLEKNIGQLTHPADTIRADTPRQPAVLRDTVRTPKRRRPFLRRIADIFSPPKEDSSIVISTRITIDSFPAASVADTIASVLHDLQDRVTGERVHIYDRAWNDGLRVRYGNEELNRKIYKLINELETEESDSVLRRADRSRELRGSAARRLALIAAGAFLLMLLLMAQLWRDIERGNRYKRALEQANGEKQALLETREKLMLAITHDIKAPLGSVIGYIGLLDRMVDDKRQKLYLQRMKGASDQLLGLVGNLLDLYRLDACKVEPNEVNFDPSELFSGIAEAFGPAADTKGLTLRAEIDPSARGRFSGDPLRIRQIAENLLSNAVKFTDRGGVTLHVAAGQGELRFSVHDTGRGIAPDERERIFREFARLPSAQGTEGSGLGLSIVERLVRLLKGTIALESAPGEGSRFSVAIPMEAARVETPLPPAGGARVLLIDDDPLQLEVAAGMCRAAGLDAACCQHPEYAARLVTEQRFDIVFTDIQMPAADGFGVLKSLREAAPGLPVVAVSARADLPAETLRAEGFAAVLRKPFTTREIVRTVRDLGLTENTSGAGAADPAEGGFAALTAYAGDDPEAARRIVASFAEQTEQNLRRLAEATTREEVAGIAAVAHKMSPIFAMLGDDTIAEPLRRLERADAFSAAVRADALAVAEKGAGKVEEARKWLSLSSE